MTTNLEPEVSGKYPLLGDCVNFHGHLCPGLALGYKASVFAIRSLGEKRSEDEEIVAMVENDSCFLDAVQVITGCTLGKGNLLIRDYGKMVLSLVSRKSGTGIRVSLRAELPSLDERIHEILERIRKGQASSEEKRIFQDYQKKRAFLILSSPTEEIFSFMKIDIDPPEYARIMRSERCEVCFEPTLVTRIVNFSGKRVCIPCSMGKRE